MLPPLGISQLAAVTSTASFAVGGDTGPTHIALALGVKTVVLYGPSVPMYGKVGSAEMVTLCTSDSRKIDTSRKNNVPLEQVLKYVEPWLP